VFQETTEALDLHKDSPKAYLTNVVLKKVELVKWAA
jgi:hypothetical protein